MPQLMNQYLRILTPNGAATVSLPAGSGHLRVARSTGRLVKTILQDSAYWKSADRAELLQAAREIRAEMQGTNQPLDFLTRVFALANAAVYQLRGIHLHPCQISGGIIMARGGVAEMATGEGKTLTAVLPVVLWSMLGRGVHVITTNDYLADRDAEELRSIYESLGLTVACITQKLEQEARRQAYRRDITYGTASEIGFDFLRDRMKLGPEQAASRDLRYASGNQHQELVQRPLFAAMVDEADSVLIDDARTPLIIGVEAPQSMAKISLFRWCKSQVSQLQLNDDYTIFSRQRQIIMTEQGAQKILLGEKPRFGQGLASETLLEHCERMLEAFHFFHRDQQYTVQEGEIVLIDESTNRPLEGRKLQRGLHHCLEAKEGLALSAGTETGSKVSVQSFFRMYHYLSGMTGTAWNARREFRKIYRLQVTAIPTNKKCLRQKLPTRIFISQQKKYEHITAEVLQMMQAGRAVLVGTPSIQASLQLSHFLHQAGIRHQILNAFHEAEEAEIIAQAGRTGTVTIATNMAGRGTDIKLDEKTRSAGGLHVIVTEMNSSGRVDRQLIGRSARQGDPGSYRLMLSLEDEIFFHTPAPVLRRWQQSARRNTTGEISRGWISQFLRAQKRIEKHHVKDRRRLFKSEKKERENYQRVGFCPYLETISE